MCIIINNMFKFKQLISNLFKKFLDILFPQTIPQKILTSITEEDFLKSSAKTTHEDKNIFIIFSYDDNLVRQAIKSLKFKNNRGIAKIFAQLLYDELLENLSDLRVFHNFRQPLLIPIPISKQRLKERGFNQCELIANEMAKIDSANSFILEKNILIKTKDSPHQSRIRNKAERLKNLENSFGVKNLEKLKNKNIILLDDVTTTGATFREAKKTLKKYGAKKIICVAVAH